MSASMAIQRLRDVVSVSRQSRELTTSRLGLVSDKVLSVSVSDQYVSGLVSVLAQNFSASRSRAISCR